VNLFNGIEKVARLGDNEAQVKQRALESFDKEAAPDYLKKLGFDSVAVFPNLGVKVYFQLGRAALIEMQPTSHFVTTNVFTKLHKPKQSLVDTDKQAL
jgi:hypothetical protein